jgi:hypothetical protein
MEEYFSNHMEGRKGDRKGFGPYMVTKRSAEEVFNDQDKRKAMKKVFLCAHVDRKGDEEKIQSAPRIHFHGLSQS